jgi:hypothetical protein
MKAIILGASYSLLSAYCAIGLPLLSVGEKSWHPVNLIWGFIYGLGWFAAGFFASIRSPKVQLFGSLIWPFIVLSITAYLFQALVRSSPSHLKNIGVAVAVVSLFVIFPQRFVWETWLKYIPIYTDILSAVY